MLARRVGSLTAARCLESQSSGWLLEGVSYFSLIGAPARCVAPRQAVWGQAGYYSRCPPPDLSSRKMSSKGSKQKNKKGDIPGDSIYSSIFQPRRQLYWGGQPSRVIDIGPM